MKYKVTLNNRTYEVEVEEGKAMLVDEYEAYAPAAPAPVAAAPVAAAPATAPAAPAAPAGAALAAGEVVKSPMPGNILKINVAQGQKVNEGDVLIVLEAMKMENEIVATKSGTVAQIVTGGRCEACKGDGVQKIEMHFLPDVYVPCDVCKGKRYNRETLEVRYKGKNINDVLNMTVEEACTFFENLPKLKTKLDTLYEVGLGYVTLGQSSTTLSGGEAQRVKLATELSRRSTGSTVYILDEPTTGLHMADVHKLISIIDRLADAGNTVVIIEHNLDVIKTADYIIDLGPEGGDGGGTLVFAGTPEECAACEDSYTGQFLKKML